MAAAGVAIVVGTGAYLWFQHATISDAASVWCTGHLEAVRSAGNDLHLFPPDGLPVRVDGSNYTVRSLRALGISEQSIEVLINPQTLIGDWKTADPGGFARACTSAFSAR